MTQPIPDLAYYYPAPYWGLAEVDRLKTLLLFFDGIAILLPRYMSGRESAADPVLAGPLREMGLLTILEPETFVDQTVTEALITAVAELITSGAFDKLDHPNRAAAVSDLAGVFACSGSSGRGPGGAGASVTSAGSGRPGGLAGGRWRGGGGSR